MKLSFLFAFLYAALFAGFSSPTGTLTGTVTDETMEPLIGATVHASQHGKPVASTVTDVNGRFQFQLEAGTYDLEVQYTGFTSVRQAGVQVTGGQATAQNVQLTSNAVLSEVVVVGVEAGHKRAKERRAAPVRKATAAASAPANYGVMKSTYTTASPKRDESVRAGDSRRPAGAIADTLRPEASEEHYNRIVENPFRTVATEPISTFSIDVDGAAYANVRRFLNSNQLPPADAVRLEEMVNYFDFEYTAPTGRHPFEVTTELAACPWAPEHQLLLVGLQGRAIESGQLPPSNLVFLIDVSGSMASDDKLPLVIKSLEALTDQLRPYDRVAIAVYAGAAGLVLPSTPGSDKPAIKAALERLQAGGGTAGAEGIQLAYETARKNFVTGGNNRVILCTDGDFNVGVSSEPELVRLIEEQRKSGVYLTVLGFGTGNYQDGKMQSLANKGNGNHAYIDQLSEAKKVLINEFGGTLFTIARDVKLQLHFNPAHVGSYRLLGYENRLLATEDFNDDTKDAGELGAGHRVTALYELIPPAEPTSASTEPIRNAPVPAEKNVTVGPNDLLVLQLRYKKPQGHDASQLLEYRLGAAPNGAISENLQLAAAVAEFGLLLRDSKYKGTASYAQALGLARNAAAHDKNGYRRELVALLEKAEKLAKEKPVVKR